jgi:hypothetical protein
MRGVLGLLLLIQSIAIVSFGGTADLVLDCREKIYKEDRAILSLAPLGAKRISKHHLRVNWTGGSKDFIDKPPYDEPLDGTWYSYCGFNPILNFHLIHKTITDVFAGVLLDNTTGKLIPAGEYVFFSSDKKKYFASVQPNGLDGEEWHLYSRDGVPIWKGLSGILGNNGRYRYFVAELDDPRWSADGEFQATLTCTADKNKRKTTVTLTFVKTNWEWLPRIECPK